VTDADGAMAFFYPALNRWVVLESLGQFIALELLAPKFWHQSKYVPKQLLPCRISADILN